MADRPLDVVGIGNAIVDVLSHVDDALVAKLDLAKGTMALVDAEEAAQIYDLSPPGIEVSGGSVANSMTGIASLGGACAYIGKVRDDELGGVFTHDMRAAGVEFATPKAKDGPPTARSLVFVTPDAQRTMNTYLGACAGLGPDDIDAATLRRAEVTYLEGYLWDAPAAKAAMRQAMATVHGAGRRVALSLSDPFCVDRYRAEFRALVEHEVDILFANEAELTSLYEVSHFDDAFQHVRGHCEMAALTRAEQGLGGDQRRGDPRRRCRPHRHRGGHDRRGRPLCRRVPLRPHPRARPGALWPARRIGRWRGDRPFRRPARDLAGPARRARRIRRRDSNTRDATCRAGTGSDGPGWSAGSCCSPTSRPTS